MEENFNWVEDYINIQSKKDIKNTNAYETLINNNIDTNELLNIEKEEGAGTYTIDKNFKPEEANKNEFVNNLLSFGEDLKTTIASRVPEGGVNILDFGTNIFNSFDRLFSLDPNYKSTDIFNKWSENLDNTRNYFKEKREGVESKVADIAGLILQDMPAYFVIDKILKKTRIPKQYRMPLAIGLSYAMSYETEDDKASMFIPSENIKEFKNLLGILPDTPEEELLHDFIQLGEGYGGAKIFQGIGPVIKWIKRNVPRKTVSDVAAGAAASGVLAKTAMDEAEARRTEELEKITTVDEDKIRDQNQTLKIKTIIQKMKEASDHPDEFPSTDSDFSALSELSSDPENFPSTDYDFEVILGQKDKEPTTDAEIDKAYGKGSVEKEFERLKNTEEKKIDDQSSNKTMMEEFYALDKTQLQKISEATGYPVDKLQSAGANKIFTDIAQDPKTWQTVKKIITGISRQKKTIPTTLEQQQLAIPFIKTFDDDVKVLTYKVDDSVGKFSDDLERNLDIEALVKNDFDKKKIINTAVQQAKKYDQDSVFVSEQVLGRTKGSNAAFSVRFSTSKKFGDVIDISKELEKITGLQGYTFKTKALNLDTLPIANPKFIPNKRLYHNAIKRNGTTSNFRVAAFIGPDGRMIDGGGGSQVARKVEHRDVVKLAYDSRKVTDFEYIHGADFSQMYRFMEETGSIRISANGPRVSVEIYQKPTLSQLKTLVKKYNDDESFLGITIEAVMPKGKSVKSFTRVEPEYMLELQGKINLSQLEKFLDFQAIRAKRFISIDSMNIPEYSNISNKAFIEKLVKIESNLSNTFGTKDISKPKLEYYINNVINKEDYAKYK